MSVVPDRIHYLDAPAELAGIGSCVTVGTAAAAPGRHYPPAALRHPSRYRSVSSAGRVLAEYQLVYVDSGTGRYEDERASTEVGPGSVIVIRPGHWHRYRPDPRTGWREYWAGFSGAAFDNAIRALGLDRRAPVLPTGRRSEIASGFLRLLELAELPGTGNRLEMVATLLHLLVLTFRFAEEASASRGPRDAVHRALEIMHDRLAGPLPGRLGIDGLARECGVSPSTLRRSFVRTTGTPPARHFSSLKVDAAKFELAHTDLPVKSIAARLGFTDQFHLSRVFRQHTGSSPSEWRRAGRA